MIIFDNGQVYRNKIQARSLVHSALGCKLQFVLHFIGFEEELGSIEGIMKNDYLILSVTHVLITDFFVSGNDGLLEIFGLFCSEVAVGETSIYLTDLYVFVTF